eukprot:scaffold51_cov125-Skeletonema_dohrnii-CCMP3373.AAC.2
MVEADFFIIYCCLLYYVDAHECSGRSRACEMRGGDRRGEEKEREEKRLLVSELTDGKKG